VLLKLLTIAAAFLMLLFAVRSRIAPFLPQRARAALDARTARATNALIVAGAAAVMLIVGFLLFLHWLDVR
jgi:hypothetical protein